MYFLVMLLGETGELCCLTFAELRGLVEKKSELSNHPKGRGSSSAEGEKSQIILK